ncbi:MAG: PEGA domain-containing protein, partial [Deltaproteobacteria bacterium]
RTRRARELLSPRNSSQVDQIVLDGLASEHYAAAFPTQAALLSQLGAAAAVGADALRRLIAEDQAGSDPGRLHTLLAELARHGAIAALLDRHGQDLLPGGASFRPPSSPPSSARAGRSAAATAAVSAPPAAAPAALAPAVVAPAAVSQPPSIALGEAVLDAVSAQPIPHVPGEPAFAPEAASSVSPSEPPEEGAAHQAAVARAAFDGAEQAEQAFFSPDQAAAAATDPSPPPDPAASEQTAAESSAAALERNASATSAERAPSDAALDDGSNADADLGANSVTAVADDDDRLANDDDSAWPPSPGSRLRTALGRGLLSLGAATAAFLAIRALASRSWDSQSESQTDTAVASTSGAALVASGAAASALAASGQAVAGLESAPEAQRAPAGADAGARTGTNPTPVPPVSSKWGFDSELLELAPGTKLPLGQGALEIRSPQRQRIYVDGVLMGDAAERLIPLGPGTYQLRLNDGAHDVERSVEVKAGRRTRLSARPSNAP